MGNSVKDIAQLSNQIRVQEERLNQLERNKHWVSEISLDGVYYQDKEAIRKRIVPIVINEMKESIKREKSKLKQLMEKI